MKTIRSCLKPISILLMFLITLQSCTVYRSNTVTIDEAVQSENKVKIKTSSKDTYEFEKLKKENDQIYGIVKSGSLSAKKLADKGYLKEVAGKYVTILIENDLIDEIYLKNIPLSKTLTIAIPIVGSLALLGLIAVLSASNMSISNDVLPI